MSEQLKELPAVARNIHLPCKKCACDRYHVVVAHTSTTSAKVKCEVCGAQKTFRLPKLQQRKVSSGTLRTRTAAAAKKTDGASLWSELKGQIGIDNAQPYSMKIKYEMANAIQHPKFGIGFVVNTFEEKIEVAFQEGGRVLVHNRQ